MSYKYILVSLFLIFSSTIFADLNVIPKPNNAVEYKEEKAFKLSSNTKIYFEEGFEKEAKFLQKYLEEESSLKLAVAPLLANSQGILLSTKPNLKKEAYDLRVSDKSIELSASTAQGLFYGTQTLRQLITADATVPASLIQDSPRFGWRGMHLDVGRHMFEMKDIKRFLDMMAFQKMNTFHWHLTEDQGWRIEIKKYPKLTSIGGFRASTPHYGGKADGQRYGGFYTQEQVKEIIQYAADRHITVVPEIDMPGHMSAAIAAYPWIGNDDIPNFKPEVKSTFGIHGYILSPKEETFEFIDNVLEEVCALFPSQYIHIGGDEASKGQWKQSKFAQSVIKREGLHDEHELQSYFIKRVEKMLDKRDKKLIGWDEIREGGLSPKATMMQWRGMHHAVASAKEGHDVVIAQNVFTYFNCYQHDIAVELQKSIKNRAGDRVTTLAKTYSLDPVAPELKGTQFEKHVLGAQGQLWSEYLKTWDKLEYMAFPRFFAISEVIWTDQEKRNYDEFLVRLKPMLKRLDKEGIRYFDPFNPGTIKTKLPLKVTTNIKYRDYDYPELMFEESTRFGLRSHHGLKKGDYVLIELEEANDAEVSVESGRYNRKHQRLDDSIENGVLEFSADGKKFSQSVEFKEGKAKLKPSEAIKFIRIRVTKDQRPRVFIPEVYFNGK